MDEEGADMETIDFKDESIPIIISALSLKIRDQNRIDLSIST